MPNESEWLASSSSRFTTLETPHYTYNGSILGEGLEPLWKRDKLFSPDDYGNSSDIPPVASHYNGYPKPSQAHVVAMQIFGNASGLVLLWICYVRVTKCNVREFWSVNSRQLQLGQSSSDCLQSSSDYLQVHRSGEVLVPFCLPRPELRQVRRAHSIPEQKVFCTSASLQNSCKKTT